MRWLLRSVLVIVVLLAVLALYTFAEAGEFREVVPLPLASCEAVSGMPGAEDLVVDRDRSVALVSSDDRTWSSEGAIFAYDLEAGGEPRRLTPPGGTGFHPHGLSLVAADAGGASLLYVVDHPTPEQSQVRVFSWNGDELVPVRTVTDPLFVGLNDVAALDDTRFLATNDHDRPPGTSQRVLDLLQLSRGNVVYWDGEKASVVAEGIPYANGIALSLDHAHVYVASTTKGRILRFERDEESGALVQVDTYELQTGADNIEVDGYGNLWIGAHPKLLTFLRHAGDHARRSPSEVVFVDPSRDLEPPIRPVWRDTGELLSGSSVGVPWGSKLIIGSVFDPGILVCER
jgi:arylesterase/paraoxonase